MSCPDQFEVFPTRLQLRRIEPLRNMRRFYQLTVQPDLFGGASLIREWGRIGSPGTLRIDHHLDEGAAVSALLDHLRHRRRRGYVRVPERAGR